MHAGDPEPARSVDDSTTSPPRCRDGRSRRVSALDRSNRSKPASESGYYKTTLGSLHAFEKAFRRIWLITVISTRLLPLTECLNTYTDLARLCEYSVTNIIDIAPLHRCWHTLYPTNRSLHSAAQAGSMAHCQAEPKVAAGRVDGGCEWGPFLCEQKYLLRRD